MPFAAVHCAVTTWQGTLADSSRITESTPTTPAASKPGIYRGWPIAVVAALSLGGSIGTAQQGFQVFILPLEEEFGWTRTQVNVSLVLGVAMAWFSPFVGVMMDRFGARWVMASSLAMIALGFFLRATMTELWQFYLFTILIYLGTPGASMLPAGRLIGMWFPSTRGRMMGIVTSGNNLGGMITIFFFGTFFIVLVGWRWSFFAIGVAMLVITVLAIVIVRDHPDDVEREAGKRWGPGAKARSRAREMLSGWQTRDAVRSSTFWFLTIGMTVQQFARTAVSTQLIPHLEQVGFSTKAAALSISLMMLFAILSKLASGRLSESITARNTYVVIISIQIVGLAFIVLAGGTWLVWPALMVFGFGIGGVGALGPLAITEAFGLRNFGVIQGLTRPAMTVPLVGGPLMAGILFDRTETYDLAFTIVIAFLVVAIASLLLARPQARPDPGQIATGSSGEN